ncbi:MAG TPA: LuxR C-terminal-related transcriptional regulator [Streptosporangiaceae bacterium]
MSDNVMRPDTPPAAPAALLADLAAEASALAVALDSARQRLAAVGRPAGVAGQPGGPPGRPGAARLPAAGTSEIIEELLRPAEREVMLVGPGGDATCRWLAELARPVGAAAERGCRVRLLLGRPVLAAAHRVGTRVTAAGGEVRAGLAPGRALLTADLRAAISAAPGAAAPVTIVTESPMVNVLRDFTRLLWDGAAPLRPPAPVPLAGCAADHRKVQRAILQLLADGGKDEAIARSLGISVRTCRRHIAEIMVKLGAASRFQAGARAARLGLLLAGPPVEAHGTVQPHGTVQLRRARPQPVSPARLPVA